MSTCSSTSPQTFNDLEAACRAIGDTRNIAYMATIDGVQDKDSTYAYACSEFRYGLKGRKFNGSRGDSVQVWLPMPA